MVETPARVAEARSDVLGLEVGELVEHLCCTETGRQEVENVAHADSQATNAGAAATLSGVDGDAFGKLRHGATSWCTRG
jgi:hypothetical protein